MRNVNLDKWNGLSLPRYLIKVFNIVNFHFKMNVSFLFLSSYYKLGVKAATLLGSYLQISKCCNLLKSSSVSFVRRRRSFKRVRL